MIWSELNRLSLSDTSSLGAIRYMRVRYEGLASGKEAVIQQLFEFAGLPFDDAFLSRLSNMINSASIGRNGRDNKKIARFADEQVLKTLGYG